MEIQIQYQVIFPHCSNDQALELVAQAVELPSLEVFKWPLGLTLGDAI